MAEFLDLLESLPASRASNDHLYRDEGVRARSLARRHRRYDQAFSEAAVLVRDTLEGDFLAAYRFKEAMGTDDFPLLFGDILDRMLLGAWQEFPSDILNVARQSRVRDFRNVKRFAVDGAESTLPKVGEREQYPEAKLTEQKDEYGVEKYGRVLDFSWEQFVNDDLDALRDAPARHARAARRSEAKFVTDLFVDANGPHASLYTAGQKNQIVTANGAATNNPALSVAGLNDAYNVLARAKDTEDEPIVIDSLYLVIPPSLEITARNILEGIHLEIASGGGTTTNQLVAPNWMRGRLQVIVDPYIPIVASTANGSTSWFLFGNPSVSRPALEFGRLIGHEQPEIWVKSPNATRVGGGVITPEMGDFEHDSVRYRIRHVFGGTRLINTGGAKTTVASNGSGS